MASSPTSALSSMEVMLDALMQRGIGKPKEQKPKEEEPPALPARPTGRGRLPSLHKPTATAPWIIKPPLLSPLPPPQEEDDEMKHLVNLELERRAATAEEELKQKKKEMRHKEDLITTLRQQVEHYESQLSECEVRMKSVEEELQKQIASLQMAQTARGRRGGPMTTSQCHQESSRAYLAPSQPSARWQHRACEPDIVSVRESSFQVNELAKEFERESEAFDINARAVVEAKQSPSRVKSVDELNTLRRQFVRWKKDYEARLKKTNTELRRIVHTEKNHGDSHNHHQRWGWWRIKTTKCRAPKCFSFKLPSTKLCSSCFRCCC
nr:unnamed protein product [Digitaria exilis]